MATRKVATIRTELEQIRDAHDGQIPPEAVVAFATNKNTALHAEFEWDNTEAAHQFRLEQARRIIRLNINIVPTENGNVRVPMYVSLVSDRKNGSGYRTLNDVMSDEDMREQFLQQALDDFQRVRRKYETLQELTPVFSALDRVAIKIKRGQQKTRA
jgi:hypothetical protein